MLYDNLLNIKYIFFFFFFFNKTILLKIFLFLFSQLQFLMYLLIHLQNDLHDLLFPL